MTVQSHTRLPQQAGQSSQTESNGSNNGMTVQSAYDWVADTARNNPVLVVGGAVAVGALVVMAVTSRKAPQSRVRTFEKQIRRDLASAEKALRRSVNNSGVMSGLAELPSAVASRFSHWDADRLEALTQRASQFAGDVAARASAALRSRG